MHPFIGCTISVLATSLSPSGATMKKRTFLLALAAGMIASVAFTASASAGSVVDTTALLRDLAVNGDDKRD